MSVTWGYMLIYVSRVKQIFCIVILFFLIHRKKKNCHPFFSKDERLYSHAPYKEFCRQNCEHFEGQRKGPCLYFSVKRMFLISFIYSLRVSSIEQTRTYQNKTVSLFLIYLNSKKVNYYSVCPI